MSDLRETTSEMLETLVWSGLLQEEHGAQPKAVLEFVLSRPSLLLEVSLSRIYQHWKDHEFAILTSWKSAGKKTQQQNLDDLDELKLTLKKLGFGHIRLLGHGEEEKDPEKPGPKTVPVTEPSLLVVNVNIETGEPQPSFRDLIIGLGEKYNQWSIMYHHPETGSEQIRTTQTIGGVPAEVTQRYKKFVPGVADYYSQVWQRRGDPEAGTFHLESKRRPLFIRYADRPHNWIEGMGHESRRDIGFGYYNSLPLAVVRVFLEVLKDSKKYEKQLPRNQKHHYR